MKKVLPLLRGLQYECQQQGHGLEIFQYTFTEMVEYMVGEAFKEHDKSKKKKNGSKHTFANNRSANATASDEQFNAHEARER